MHKNVDQYSRYTLSIESQQGPKQPSKYLVDPTTSNSKVLRVKTSQISRRPDRNQLDSEYEARKSSRNPQELKLKV